MSSGMTTGGIVIKTIGKFTVDFLLDVVCLIPMYGKIFVAHWLVASNIPELACYKPCSEIVLILVTALVTIAAFSELKDFIKFDHFHP